LPVGLQNVGIGVFLRFMIDKITTTKTLKTCELCKGEFLGAKNQRMHRECRLKWDKDRHRRANPNPGEELCSGTTGALHELIVCVDLMRKPWIHVFRGQSPACIFDFVAYNSVKRLSARIEVKTGYRTVSGKMKVSPEKHMDHRDILAVVMRDGTITYTGNTGLLDK
jgi:hypothetical protein